MIRQDEVEIKINRYIGVYKHPEDTPSDIISRITTACKNNGISSPLIDMRRPIVEQIVIVKGKEIAFFEVFLNNDERTMNEICNAILDMQYPCYRGDLIMPIGNDSLVFKDFIVLMAPSAPGHPKGGGIHVARYFIDEQCNIVFPTANFKTNQEKAWFKELRITIPVAYNELITSLESDIVNIYGGMESEAAQLYARKQLSFLARASKIYPVNMIWAENVIPPPVREMLPAVPCKMDNALQYMEMADVDRLGMIDHLGRLNDQGIIQPMEDASPGNVVDMIGDTIVGGIDVKARALLGIEREIASSKYGGEDIELRQISDDTVMFKIKRRTIPARPGPDPAPGSDVERTGSSPARARSRQDTTERRA